LAVPVVDGAISQINLMLTPSPRRTIRQHPDIYTGSRPVLSIRTGAGLMTFAVSERRDPQRFRAYRRTLDGQRAGRPACSTADVNTNERPSQIYQRDSATTHSRRHHQEHAGRDQRPRTGRDPYRARGRLRTVDTGQTLTIGPEVIRIQPWKLATTRPGSPNSDTGDQKTQGSEEADG
jgi:hypothetical protein